MRKSDKDIYLELLKEIKDKQDESKKLVLNLDKKLELHVQKTELELVSINKLDKQQNELLEDHMRRTELLEKSLDQHRFENFRTKEELHKKIEKANKPMEYIKVFGTVILWLGGLAGSAFAIGRFFEVF